MKTKTKLNWKKKWLDDDSGYWFSAKVPVIGWEYVVDIENDQGYIAGVYYSNYVDDITKISKKYYKTEEAAMEDCEKHLLNTAEKFKKWIEKK